MAQMLKAEMLKIISSHAVELDGQTHAMIDLPSESARTYGGLPDDAGAGSQCWDV